MNSLTMNGTRVRMTTAMLATILLVACGGLTKSPADGLTFKAPSGWPTTPGIMGRFQLWTTGEGKDKQVLVLLKLPPQAKIDKSSLDLVNGENSGGVQGAQVVSRKEMTLCGNQPSIYVMMRGESSREKVQENLAAVFSKGTDATYMAMYVYPVGTSPNARAEAAISELCPLLK
jgi:hypothetical protein